jgi:hypothetical protein
MSNEVIKSERAVAEVYQSILVILENPVNPTDLRPSTEARTVKNNEYTRHVGELIVTGQFAKLEYV